MYEKTEEEEYGKEMGKTEGNNSKTPTHTHTNSHTICNANAKTKSEKTVEMKCVGLSVNGIHVCCCLQ